MLWTVISFFPGFVKLLLIGLLFSILIEGMVWILEIPGV
jgi:hypothetical protein